MLIAHKNTVTYSVEICYCNHKHYVYSSQAQCARSTCNFSLAPPAHQCYRVFQLGMAQYPPPYLPPRQQKQNLLSNNDIYENSVYNAVA